jgi:hypothetical protein
MGGFSMKNMKWLALFFVILFFGCFPNNNNSEQFLDLTEQEYSWDYDYYPYGRKMVSCVMTSSGVLQRSSTFTGGPILAVWVTVEEDYFRKEQSQNVGYFKLED